MGKDCFCFVPEGRLFFFTVEGHLSAGGFRTARGTVICVTPLGAGAKNRKKSIFRPSPPKLIILLAVLNSPLLTDYFSLPGVRQPTLGCGAKCRTGAFCPTPSPHFAILPPPDIIANLNKLTFLDYGSKYTVS